MKCSKELEPEEDLASLLDLKERIKFKEFEILTTDTVTLIGLKCRITLSRFKMHFHNNL